MTAAIAGGPVVVAPNAMRGHLDARGVAAALAAGIAGAAPGIALCEVPLADGGDGTLDVVARATGGVRHRIEVRDALGRPRPSEWLDLGTSALVECALCCGLAPLRASELDPMRATSAGVGEAIAAAVRAGHREVYVGLGGTAVVDGGAGALAALGVRFLDAHGDVVPAVPAALRDAVLADLRSAQELLAGARLRLLADVSTSYTSNATHFGAQKGLTDADRPAAAAAMAHLVDLACLAGPVGGADLLRNRSSAPWWGAGGGTGLGLAIVAEAGAEGGTLAVLALADPDSTVLSASLVVTAEGIVDASTWTGKVPGAVATLRRDRRLPTAVVAAQFRDGAAPDPMVGRQLLDVGGSAPLTERLAAAGAAAWQWFGAAQPTRRPTATSAAGRST